jgi:putative nucleotidyltransferase with HDIG domain
MERDELRTRIYSRIDELPTLPVVIPRLLSLMNAPKAGTREITEALSHDTALTAKILKVANSAYYGFSREISSLDRAVALLGFNMVRSLALSVGVINVMPGKKNSRSFSREGLWIHNLAVGTAVKMMAERLGKGESAEHLFVVGLLHDIGKVVLDQFFSEDFTRVLEQVNEGGGTQLYEMERNNIGLDHGEVGGILLERWKFPGMIQVPIAFHHRNNFPGDMNLSDFSMLKISDALVQQMGLGDSGNASPPQVNEADMKRLGIDQKELREIREQMAPARDGILAFFGAMN